MTASARTARFQPQTTTQWKHSTQPKRLERRNMSTVQKYLQLCQEIPAIDDRAMEYLQQANPPVQEKICSMHNVDKGVVKTNASAKPSIQRPLYVSEMAL